MTRSASIGAVATARAYLHLQLVTSLEALSAALRMPSEEFHDAVIAFGKEWLMQPDGEKKLYAELDRREALLRARMDADEVTRHALVRTQLKSES